MIPVRGYSDHKVAVLGLGRSGLSAARALEAGGAIALCWDDSVEARARAEEAVKLASAEMAAASAKRHEAFGQELAAKTQEAEGRIVRAKEEALAHVSAVANEVAAAVGFRDASYFQRAFKARTGIFLSKDSDE